MKQVDIVLKGYRICARTPELFKVRFPTVCQSASKAMNSILSFMNGRFYKSAQRYGVFYINENINSDKWEVNILSATY